jgi:hypothetical protein
VKDLQLEVEVLFADFRDILYSVSEAYKKYGTTTPT